MIRYNINSTKHRNGLQIHSSYSLEWDPSRKLDVGIFYNNKLKLQHG